MSFDSDRIKFKPEEDQERTEVLVSLGKSCNSGLRIIREEKEKDLKGAKMIKSKAYVGIQVRKDPDVEQQLEGLGQRGACRCQDLH